MQILALGIIAFTVFLIVRRYQTQGTLFLAGFALLSLAYVHGLVTGQAVPELEPSRTGWFGFDLFALITESFSKRTVSIGLLIMAAGGFARYMSHIHAATALVKLAIAPVSRISNPYLLLSLAYLTGQSLNVFVPSAAGLAMLLLVAMYPTLVRLKLRPAAVAAVIGTTSCLDLGPASGTANVAAAVAGLEPVIFFVRHQLPVALVVMPVVAILHLLWQRHCDRTEGPAEADLASVLAPPAGEEPEVPRAYALLPLMPLVLLMVFSPLFIDSVRIDVITAMLISLFAGVACEAIRHRSVKQALAGMVPFFTGMGDIFAKVVTLIVAAEIFAMGVKATGLITGLIGLVTTHDLGSFVMTVAMVALIGLTALLTGSGQAALFSFANLIPDAARAMGAQTISMVLPGQLAAGIFRSMSPVSGVIIAVSSAANVSPFAIVKRTSVPMLGAALATILANALIN